MKDCPLARQQAQRQQQAEVILLRCLAAWQEPDPATRLAACACCKLEAIAWQQSWADTLPDRSETDPPVGR